MFPYNSPNTATQYDIIPVLYDVITFLWEMVTKELPMQNRSLGRISSEQSKGFPVHLQLSSPQRSSTKPKQSHLQACSSQPPCTGFVAPRFPRLIFSWLGMDQSWSGSAITEASFSEPQLTPHQGLQQHDSCRGLALQMFSSLMRRWICSSTC